MTYLILVMWVFSIYVTFTIARSDEDEWMTNKYYVTLSYEGNIPDYYGAVFAKDEAHAERLVSYDAISDGWPRAYTTAVVEDLLDDLHPRHWGSFK